MAGDDYGAPTRLPWAVTFTNSDAARIGGAPLGVPLHPVQLYESIVCLALFAVLVRLSRRKRFDGEVILAYTSLYAMLGSSSSSSVVTLTAASSLTGCFRHRSSSP
jgi:phosphatidylglycerol:prolipoprotein diacylglycerol transferase